MPDFNVAAAAGAIRERLAALPASIVKLCRLENITNCLDDFSMPFAFAPGHDLPVLSGVWPIEPIADVDELIDVASRVLLDEYSFGNRTSPADYERMVDAIVRLGEETTDNFTEKTEGLRTQATTRPHAMAQYRDHMEWFYVSTEGMLAAWLEVPSVLEFVNRSLATTHDVKTGILNRLSRNAGLIRRTISDNETPLQTKHAELFQRIIDKQFGPVLSTPTHTGGWIEAKQFVNRVLELQRRSIPIGPLDFIGGVLRLAADGKADAIERCEAVHDPYRRLIRYALGAEEYPTSADKNTAALWLAAARRRNPYGELSELAALGLDDQDCPDGITPAKYEINPAMTHEFFETHRWGGGPQTSFLHVSPCRTDGNLYGLYPTVALASRLTSGSRDFSATDSIAVRLASIHPTNTDSSLACAVNLLIARLNEKGSVYESVTGLMSPLLDVDRVWTEVAYVALAAGLVSRDEMARGVAVDALIEGITDGRADQASLTGALVELETKNWVKHNRLANYFVRRES